MTTLSAALFVPGALGTTQRAARPNTTIPEALDYRGSLPYRSVIKADLEKPCVGGIFKIL